MALRPSFADAIHKKGEGMINLRWLLLETLMILIIVVEVARLIRNARRKQRAQALRARAIEA